MHAALTNPYTVGFAFNLRSLTSVFKRQLTLVVVVWFFSPRYNACGNQWLIIAGVGGGAEDFIVTIIYLICHKALYYSYDLSSFVINWHSTFL